jgi:hypothetical protein
MEKKIYRTGYMSEIDIFLKDFDQKRKQFPASRQKEIEKHQKIFAKRDQVLPEDENPIWQGF